MFIFLKIFRESIRFAWHALVTNKLRTLLSLLGITIGIFAIISVFTAVDALERNVSNSVASLGENVIYIQKWPWAFSNDYPWWKYFQRPVPQLKEMNELKRRTSTVEHFVYEAFLNEKTIKYRSNAVENATIVITSHDYDKIKSFDMKWGRYLSEVESQAGRPVIVIGSDISDKLFGASNPVGKDITLMGRKLAVIGVFAKEGSSLFENSSDELVVIPVNFAKNIIDLNTDRVGSLIAAKAFPGITIEEMRDDLKSAMRAIRQIRPREEEDFALNEAKLLSTQVESIFSVISLAGAVIGGFSILVGGFGIANIMFVSVKERTSMIGIQKSLGAKNYFILLQFLVEAVFLCLIGGVIGLLFVYAAATTATVILDFDMSLTLKNIIIGLTVSAVIGIISGFVPAWMASRLDPVEAIRAN